MVLPWLPPERLFCLLDATNSRWTMSSDECGAPFAAQNGRNRTRLADREHNDRHTIFPGKREGRRVHDLEVALDRLVVGQALVTLGLWVQLRVGAVNTVDIGGLQKGVTIHLGGAEHSR